MDTAGSGAVRADAPLNWDDWRARYDEATFADQQAFYEQVFERCRGQARFDARTFAGLLEYIGGPVEVVELGGWDGEFAAVTLATHPQVRRWVNYEISAAAVAGSVCADPRYEGMALDAWYWEAGHATDVFVASHVLEHLRWRDVLRVFDATDARWLYLQAPLGEKPRDWAGYHGSHILEVGWAQLTEELRTRGYRPLLDLSTAGARCFEEAI